MKIAKGCVVQLDYELRVKGGEVIESSSATGPLRYVHGEGKMLPALEARLAGLGPGDERRGDIPSQEAFGTEESAPIATLPRGAFPKDAELVANARFEGKHPVSGIPVQLLVVGSQPSDGESRADDTVLVKLLHPLVGKDLSYRVRVLSVEDADVRGVPPPPPGAVELDLQPED